MVEVTGANCPSCNGCYKREENYLPFNDLAYLGSANLITFDHQVGHWIIVHKSESDFEREIDFVGQIFYESTSSFDGPQGKYKSLDDDSIATVKCKSVCIDDKKLYNLK